MLPRKSITAEPIRDRPNAPIVPKHRSRAVSGGNRNKSGRSTVRYDQSGIASPYIDNDGALSRARPRATTLPPGGRLR